mmetsp:Transcript_59684/g.141913  ORF Transcript_59684/g.141913 Transcript_59684/m.141913 type:complete len:299 (-) Transcript_59684:90-986(-)
MSGRVWGVEDDRKRTISAGIRMVPCVEHLYVLGVPVLYHHVDPTSAEQPRKHPVNRTIFRRSWRVHRMPLKLPEVDPARDPPRDHPPCNLVLRALNIHAENDHVLGFRDSSEIRDDVLGLDLVRFRLVLFTHLRAALAVGVLVVERRPDAALVAVGVERELLPRLLPHRLGMEDAVVLCGDCTERRAEARLGLEDVRLELRVPRAKVRDPSAIVRAEFDNEVLRRTVELRYCQPRHALLPVHHGAEVGYFLLQREHPLHNLVAALVRKRACDIDPRVARGVRDALERGVIQSGERGPE